MCIRDSPKDMIFPVMDEIRKVVLTAPVKAGTILCVAASVVASLLPPLLLAGIIAVSYTHLRKATSNCSNKAAWLRCAPPNGSGCT